MTDAVGPSQATLLEVARAAALRGGEVALAMWAQVQAARDGLGTKSSPTDLVTAADHAAEAAIRDVLRSADSTVPVLGEEAGGDEGPIRRGIRWVVDPIDGTVNYWYGRPDFAVAVAAEDASGPVVGVVHAPALGHTWTAVRGGGSWCDGVPLRVSSVSALDVALVATGFGYRAERRAAQGAVVAALLPRVRDIRRVGAAALDLCSLASGGVDAYFERGLQPWDIAAGSLVATEAGAVVVGLHGRRASADMLVAAGPGMARHLVAFLESQRADEGP
jgi:myo-inositol-1(or 4)-monophosphatase